MKRNRDAPDMTGQSRLLGNVLYGWLAQVVFIAAGFILPRMIDKNLGKESLGVWDFAWSLIIYFEIIYSGLITSINRYVAKHRSVGDIAGVSKAVSSIFFVLLGLGAIVVMLVAACAMAIPPLMGRQLGDQVAAAQWVVFLLGLSLVVKMTLSVFGGVITGCHRWDLQHGINAASRLATTVGMVAVLSYGGGLRALALAYLLCDAAVMSSRCSLAFRVCPGLTISPRLASRATAKNMWRFGVKSLIPDIGDMLNNQTLNILFVWYLGPAVLAGYARPRNLTKLIQTFSIRYTYTLTPTASSLQALRDVDGLRRMIIGSCRTGAYIVLPMVMVLGVMGGLILQVWMGQRYMDNLLPVVLALGALPVLLQLPLHSMLRGLNTHGWPGVFKFTAAITGIGAAFVTLAAFGGGVIPAAVAAFAPFWFSELVVTPLYASRKHGFSLAQYWRAGILQPLVAMAPMVSCLLFFRLALRGSAVVLLIGGTGASMVVLAVTYWFFAAPESLRERVRVGLGRRPSCGHEKA